jgi:hypothetical protein
MFLTRGFIFRKTIVYAIMVWHKTYYNYIYNRLPEDELSVSKYVEDQN